MTNMPFPADDALLEQLHLAYKALIHIAPEIGHDDTKCLELKKLLLAVGGEVNMEALNPESSPKEAAQIEADIQADRRDGDEENFEDIDIIWGLFEEDTEGNEMPFWLDLEPPSPNGMSYWYPRADAMELAWYLSLACQKPCRLMVVDSTLATITANFAKIDREPLAVVLADQFPHIALEKLAPDLKPLLDDAIQSGRYDPRGCKHKRRTQSTQ